MTSHMPKPEGGVILAISTFKAFQAICGHSLNLWLTDGAPAPLRVHRKASESVLHGTHTHMHAHTHSHTQRNFAQSPLHSGIALSMFLPRRSVRKRVVQLKQASTEPTILRP
jgi:hypothetical protein